MRILGLDVGDKRIGVALSDPTGTIASSLPTIRRLGTRKDLQTIRRLIAEYDVDRIVVGLPLLPNGRAGEQAEKVRAFADSLRTRTNVPVEFRDERFSTSTAYEIMVQTGAKRSARRDRVDAVAAAVILQEYLDSIASVPRLDHQMGDMQP